MERSSRNEAAEQKRRRWERPAIRTVGTIGEVLHGGGGKLSPTDNDPGDNRKPKGNE